MGSRRGSIAELSRTASGPLQPSASICPTPPPARRASVGHRRQRRKSVDLQAQELWQKGKKNALNTSMFSARVELSEMEEQEQQCRNDEETRRNSLSIGTRRNSLAMEAASLKAEVMASLGITITADADSVTDDDEARMLKMPQALSRSHSLTGALALLPTQLQDPGAGSSGEVLAAREAEAAFVRVVSNLSTEGCDTGSLSLLPSQLRNSDYGSVDETAAVRDTECKGQSKVSVSEGSSSGAESAPDQKAELTSEIPAREAQLTARQSAPDPDADAQAKLEALREAQAAVSAREVQLSAREAALTVREAQLAAKLSARETAITAREAQLSAKISVREAAITAREAQLAASDAAAAAALCSSCGSTRRTNVAAAVANKEEAAVATREAEAIAREAQRTASEAVVADKEASAASATLTVAQPLRKMEEQNISDLAKFKQLEAKLQSKGLLPRFDKQKLTARKPCLYETQEWEGPLSPGHKQRQAMDLDLSALGREEGQKLVPGGPKRNRYARQFIEKRSDQDGSKLPSIPTAQPRRPVAKIPSQQSCQGSLTARRDRSTKRDPLARLGKER